MPRIQRWCDESGNTAGNFEARLYKDSTGHYIISKKSDFTEKS